MEYGAIVGWEYLSKELSGSFGRFFGAVVFI